MRIRRCVHRVVVGVAVLGDGLEVGQSPGALSKAHEYSGMQCIEECTHTDNPNALAEEGKGVVLLASAVPFVAKALLRIPNALVVLLCDSMSW